MGLVPVGDIVLIPEPALLAFAPAQTPAVVGQAEAHQRNKGITVARAQFDDVQKLRQISRQIVPFLARHEPAKRLRVQAVRHVFA